MSAGGEEIAGGDDTRWGEPVEAAARPILVGVLVFPVASDPPGVFEPVEHAVHGRPGSLGGLGDRPAMELGVLAERLKEDLRRSSSGPVTRIEPVTSLMITLSRDEASIAAVRPLHRRRRISG